MWLPCIRDVIAYHPGPLPQAARMWSLMAQLFHCRKWAPADPTLIERVMAVPVLCQQRAIFPQCRCQCVQAACATEEPTLYRVRPAWRPRHRNSMPWTHRSNAAAQRPPAFSRIRIGRHGPPRSRPATPHRRVQTHDELQDDYEAGPAHILRENHP